MHPVRAMHEFFFKFGTDLHEVSILNLGLKYLYLQVMFKCFFHGGVDFLGGEKLIYNRHLAVNFKCRKLC